MGFMKGLFGGRGEKKGQHVDKQGLYFYVQCDHCGSRVRVRADKQHDLNFEEGGYVWHKTIVDSRCFRHIPVVVHLDQRYQVTKQEIEGGRFLTQAQFEAAEAHQQGTDVGQTTDGQRSSG